MLAGRSSLHRDGSLDEPLVKSFYPCELGRVRAIAIEHDVEIAVTDMADDRAIKTVRRQIGARFVHALGQPGNRHADIGGKGFFSGHQGLRRPECIMPGLP